jgi:hypothetical protein
MQWLDKLQRYLKGSVTHTFLFTGAIDDDVLHQGEVARLHDVLSKANPICNAGIIAYFNRETGIRFPKRSMREDFIKLILAPLYKDYSEAVGEFERNKRDLGAALEWFGELLEIGWDSTHAQALHKDQPEEIQKRIDRKSPFAVVILEYAETIIPKDASGGQALDRRATVAFRWWATDSAIGEKHNIIILETNNTQSIAPEILSLTNNIAPIEFGLPSAEEQRENIAVLRKRYLRRNDDISDEELVRITPGLPYITLRQMMDDAYANGEPLTARLVFDTKRKLIVSLSGGLLSMYNVPYGFEALGSLDHVVEYERKVVDAMRKGDISRIPTSVIFIGPPGVGKTAAAEAMAHECDVPFVKFEQNVRDPFVGMSERRWELILNVLKMFGPLVFLMDELDRFFMDPSRMYHGDSGVTSNIQGMFMDFLGNPKVRGKVFVIAATNHPENMEKALLRSGRFDDKYPFLLPKRQHRPEIMKALFRKQQAVLLHEIGEALEITVSDAELEEIADMADFYINEEGRLKPGPVVGEIMEKERIALTGADLEVVIRRAIKNKAGKALTGEDLKLQMRKYRPTSQDTREYGRMHRLALLYVNDEDFVPPEYRDEWEEVIAKNLRPESMHPAGPSF